MKTIGLTTLAVATLLGAWNAGIAPARAAELAQAVQPSVNEDALSGFESDVERIRRDWGVPGMAVVIVKGNQVLYAKGHGLRDVAQNLPMTADTLLQIGSSSKSFTAATIASLVEEGKLDWNKPVKTWLPAFKLQDSVAAERVSLLDMVSHRTGLPRHDLVWYNEPDLTLAAITQRLQYLEPATDFRTRFEYNNIMYAAAGHVTEVVSGKSWQDTVRERVLGPLGMTRTNFNVAQSQRDGNFSLGYQKPKHGAVQIMPFSPVHQIAPAGGINSSVNEMATWLQMHLNSGQFMGNQVLSSDSIDFLHTPHSLSDDDTTAEFVPTGYAPGWFAGFYRGHRRLEHSGIIDGFASSMVIFPDDNIGIVVLANLYMTGAHAYTSRSAADRLLHLPRVDWSARALERLAQGDEHHMDPEPPEKRVAGTQPSHALPDFTGSFEHPAYGAVTVQEQQGKLSFDFHGVVTPLQHWHYDMFLGERAAVNSKFELQRMQFNTAPDGQVDSLQMDLQYGVKDIVFTRRAAPGKTGH
jgi:CubicO group peptidase (beta-lactamase class C family)